MDHQIYNQISARTGGDIYIGVVGPVRTGKSTLIKRFMETMVLPGMITCINASGRVMSCRSQAPDGPL